MVKQLKHPATGLATVALFVALGGGVALAGGLISGSQIKNHSVPESKLTAAAVSSLRGQRGPKGERGPAGPSSAGVAADVSGTPVALTNDVNTPIESLSLAAGSYVVIGNANISDATNDQDTLCLLYDVGAGHVLDAQHVDTTATSPAEAEHLVSAFTTSNATTVQLQCGTNDAPHASSTYTHLVAIKVGSVSSG